MVSTQSPLKYSLCVTAKYRKQYKKKKKKKHFGNSVFKTQNENAIVQLLL